MLDVRVDADALKALSEGWYRGHRRAVTRAFKAESYRLMRVTQAFLRAGGEGEYPPKAPLTRRIARYRRRKALGWFAPMVAYSVTDRGDDIEARVGLSSQAGRRKRPMPEELVEKLVAGHSFTVTREHQRDIAAKLRRRGRKDLRGLIPRVGTVIEFPERDYPALVLRAEADAIPRNLVLLYEMALRGERWQRTWWSTMGHGRKPTGKGTVHRADRGRPGLWRL